jgi:hypothetical protein
MTDADIGPRDRIVAEYLAPEPSMDALETRVGNLSEHVREYDRSLRAIRTDRFKYIRGSDDSRDLYVVRDDPGETEDLADTNGDIVADLNATPEEWLDSFEHFDLSGNMEMREETKGTARRPGLSGVIIYYAMRRIRIPSLRSVHRLSRRNDTSVNIAERSVITKISDPRFG